MDPSQSESAGSSTAAPTRTRLSMLFPTYESLPPAYGKAPQPGQGVFGPYHYLPHQFYRVPEEMNSSELPAYDLYGPPCDSPSPPWPFPSYPWLPGSYDHRSGPPPGFAAIHTSSMAFDWDIRIAAAAEELGIPLHPQDSFHVVDAELDLGLTIGRSAPPTDIEMTSPVQLTDESSQPFSHPPAVAAIPATSPPPHHSDASGLHTGVSSPVCLSPAWPEWVQAHQLRPEDFGPRKKLRTGDLDAYTSPTVDDPLESKAEEAGQSTPPPPP